MSKTVLLEAHNLKNRAGGFGTFNYNLIKGLSHNEHGNMDITLMSYNSGELKREFKDKFKYKRIFSISKNKNFRIRKKHDLWHALNQNLKFEPHYRSNYIMTIHDVNFADTIDPFTKDHPYYKRFEEKIARCNAITYISEFAKQHTQKYFDINGIPEYVIHNGNPVTELLDTTGYKPEVPVNKPYLFSIGDFLEKKNFVSAVKMMKHLPEFNLIIAGKNTKSYGDTVRNCIIENKLENRVFLTGKITDEGKQYYMKNCAAFVFPSVGEGFGLPPIEAMKFGKPVFLANRTSLPEIGGEYSFYWDEFDPEYMAQKFYSGLDVYNNNPALYNQKYMERANSFNWDESARKYLEVYQSVLK